MLYSESAPEREFFKGNIEQGVVLPAFPIEMPPFVREGIEPMAGHDGLELVAVLALLPPTARLRQRCQNRKKIKADGDWMLVNENKPV
jgi:hypothetical protein